MKNIPYRNIDGKRVNPKKFNVLKKIKDKFYDMSYDRIGEEDSMIYLLHKIELIENKKDFISHIEW